MNSKKKILVSQEDILATYKSRYHGVKALSKYSNWFPLYSSPALAGIVADLMGDEHLQDEPKLRLDYTSKSKEELERFNREILNLFGISGKIRKCSTNKYGTMNLGVNNKPLGRVLRLIGVPTGCKVLKKFQIPQWIFDDKKNFSRFVNRIFSCEACVDVPYKAIDFSMWKSVELIEEGTEFFRQIKYHLSKHFDIETTNPFLNNNLNTRKDGIKTQCIRIKIKKLHDLRKYHRFIGFDDKEKENKLKKII